MKITFARDSKSNNFVISLLFNLTVVEIVKAHFLCKKGSYIGSALNAENVVLNYYNGSSPLNILYQVNLITQMQRMTNNFI